MAAIEKETRSQAYAREFSEEVIKAIEAGRAPWQKEWAPGAIIAPFNPASGTLYKGANHINLIMRGGYSDPRFMTYKQAQDQGFQVKEGERSLKISFFSPTRLVDRLDDTGAPVLGADGNPEKVEVNKPFFKIANVFNASQIEGVGELEQQQPDWDPVERAETILRNSGAQFTHSQRDRALYRPSTDRIELPPKAQFSTPEGYYSTIMHELAHWTQQEGRVARQTGPKGTDAYAREELRAEIASWMINTEIGLGHDPSNHANYAAGWAKALKDDPKEIFRAARDAQKIKDFVMNLEQEKVSELNVQAENAQTENAQAGLQKAAGQEEDHQAQPATSDIAKEKTWLDVPYRQRNEAKPLGAKWDTEARSWYAPEGTDLSRLRQWIPERQLQPAPAVPPEQEFAEALKEAGLDLGGASPVMDGTLHRVPVVDGKQGNKDGAYIGHLDGVIPAGFIQNYRTGFKENWSYTGHDLSQAEKAAHSEYLAAQRRKREEEARERQEQAAKRAEEILLQARELKSHEYLKNKGVPALGVFESEYGQLLVPGRDVQGRLQTLQFIEPDGSKKFLAGGKKAGSFHLIEGRKDLVKGPVLLTEGYATGATVHEALQGKYPVAVSFDAGNLMEVAKALRESFPQAEIMICADSDLKNGKNVGLERAQEAAEAVNGAVIAPVFDPDRLSQDNTLSDFNDMAKESGMMRVKHRLNFGLAQFKSYGKDFGSEM